jgi:ubiquinone biosynthesis protein
MGTCLAFGSFEMLLLQNSLHLERSRHIAQVLARHGLGYLVSVLGLERVLPFVRTLGHVDRADPPSRPEHVRLALEEMGTTFIKLGQVLSTRADLLPPDYQAELAKLLDAASPVPSDEIKQRIEEELGQSVESLFSYWDCEPLATASIGQAHAARLKDGTEVVVKVRRPGVVEQVEEDLDILQHLAAAAARRWNSVQHYDVVGLAQEFAQTLRAELDYIREGHNAERFAENFSGDSTVHIPRIYWEATTPRVLTLERIRGVKINDLSVFGDKEVDRKGFAHHATGVLLKMIFEDGFFHADPHPGNFFMEADGGIGLIDFGMVGTVDERTQEQLAGLLLAITTQDSERLVDALLELGVTRQRVDRELLGRDLDHLMSRYYGKALGEICIGPLLEDAFAVVRRHHMHLPPNLALLLKTLVMSESVGARLDPDFHLTTALAPYAERMLLRQYSPRLWAKKLGQASLDIARLGVEAPQQLRRIIGELERGEVQIGVRPEHFEPIVGRLEQLANRIVLGVIAGAFTNGLAILMLVYRPPGWERWAWVAFTFGFVCATGLGAYLAWSILRSGRGLAGPH